ncbi:ATP-binding protein [Vreelandella sulfidaeris]|uniref:ATP-binding protein n=1 Tax=Vreelandella sulfidaeris TaxID=115553 RepID=UPI0035E8165F
MAKFAVRARAVDMLGRQQIAGVPTAIHELFKNAHDAYATRVEVDFIRELNQLVIRDNGLGMSEGDFQDRWLALGTESKFGVNSLSFSQWTGPNNLPLRPLMGEKGIGRLAIATIAPVTFVLSRAVRPDGLCELTACLVCWPLFELPGLDISDIEVPLRTFSSLPSIEDVSSMVDEVISNIEAIIPDIDTRNRLLRIMEGCKFDPIETDLWFANIAEEVEEENLSLTDDQYGTHFYLFECDENLIIDIGGNETDHSAPAIKRMLLGFGNTMSSDYSPPVRAEFRDHKPTGNFDELIGADEFFTSKDLLAGDHFFEGRFDEYGQFRGTIRIFRSEPIDLILNWPEAKGKLTACGPFGLRLGVIQGNPDETLVDPEEYNHIASKMWSYGGLYVYRDGIRILPYGLPDFDWLGIEFRRTKSASDWFFSHRRMAGYVSLNRHDNGVLNEKAGREGFRQNRAYRELQAILENWFEQVAKDFFRKSSERSPVYREILDGKRLEAKRLRERKEKALELKSRFRDELNIKHDAIESNNYERKVENILNNALVKIEKIKSLGLAELSGKDKQALSSESIKIENDAVAEFEKLGRDLYIPRPRNFSLSKNDTGAYESYLSWLDGFREKKLEPAVEKVRSSTNLLREQVGVKVSRSERARNSIAAEVNRVEGLISKNVKDIQNETEAFKDTITLHTAQLKRKFLEETQFLQSDLQRRDLDLLDNNAALESQREIEIRLENSYLAANNMLKALFDQLKAVNNNIRQDSLPDETIAALEGRISELEEQLTFYNDLAQAGSAVSILGHELENVVSGLRGAIRDIKPWADGTPDLNTIYGRLRTYYDHLDSYIGLFSPLSRRVRRQRVIVTGASILSYVRELFSERLNREGIELRETESFQAWSIHSFRSTLIAAAVNIVDNAIYWIGTDRHAERWIEFDAIEDGIIIRNGGPGVPRRAARTIFEFGMSSKPSGRGMGLAVSREALASIGLKLELLEEGTETRPAFMIQLDTGGEQDD